MVSTTHVRAIGLLPSVWVVVERESKRRARLDELARAHGEAIPLLAGGGTAKPAGRISSPVGTDDVDDVVVNDARVSPNLDHLHPDVFPVMGRNEDVHIDVGAGGGDDEVLLHLENVVGLAELAREKLFLPA